MLAITGGASFETVGMTVAKKCQFSIPFSLKDILGWYDEWD